MTRDRTSVPAIESAPSAQRNWLARDAGDPLRGRSEFALYSDARFTSELSGLGPYTIINTLAGTGDPQPGVATRALVLRIDHHLDPGESLLDPSNPITQVNAFHGGWIDDEVAALLSLALGVRCRSGGTTRFWEGDGDPLGTPAEFHHRVPYLPAPEFPGASVLPTVARETSLENARDLLTAYPRVPARKAGALVRAARRYQSALWAADDDPSLAWLQFVFALEAGASTFSHRGTSHIQRLRDDWGELAEILDRAPHDIRDAAAKEASRDVRVQRRLRALLAAHPPSPPAQRPTQGVIDWSKIDQLVMVVYRLRSEALHAGRPMPSPMCFPPHLGADAVPSEGGMGSGYGGADGSWSASDVPMLLHTFAHVTGEVLRGWWAALGGVAVAH